MDKQVMNDMNNMNDQIASHAQDWVKSFETKGMALADNIKTLITTFEAIADALSGFFGTVKKQKDTVLDFGHRAGEQIRPLTSTVTDTSLHLLDKSKTIGNRLVSKGRENPWPFILGGVAVVGGLAVLAYYLNAEEASAESEVGEPAA